jgi:cholesterol transport system auxiliary component
MTSSFSISPTRRRFLAGSGAACLLTGCSPLLGGKDAPHLYGLQAPTSFAPDLPTVRSQLAIAVPQAPQSLDIERIALAHSPTSLDYFADSAWADRTPLMIQGLLVESFENTGKIQAVGRDSGDFNADVILQAELRDFEARYDAPDQPPLIVIRIGIRLIKLPDRRIVGTFNAEGQGKASSRDIEGIVNAFNDTLGPVLRQIVEWSLRRL